MNTKTPALVTALSLPWLVTSAALAAPAPQAGECLQIVSHGVARTPGAIRDMRAVHFDDDDRLDLIVHVGGDLVYVSAPDPHQYSMVAGLQGVTAFTTLPLPGQWVHGALAAHATGLDLVERVPSPGFAFQVARTSLAGGAWAGARSVAAVDLDGDGDLDVLGLDATGTQFLTLTSVNARVWAAGATVQLPYTLRAVREATVAGGLAFAGIAEIGGGDFLVVIDAAGQELLFVSPGGPVDDFAVLHDAGAASDSFAILSGHSVVVIDDSGALEPALDLSLAAPSGISAADVDGDGLADVLANSTVADKVALVHRQPTGGGVLASLAASNLEWIDLERPLADMAGQTSRPVAADFDDDGDVDVLQFVDAVREASLRRATAVDETQFHAELIDVQWFISPVGSSAGVTLRIPALVDGTAPDRIEMQLSSTPTVGLADMRHRHKANMSDDVAQFAVGDVVTLWIDWNGELGEDTALAVRALGVDPTGAWIDSTGVETGFRFRSSVGRGTIHPVDPIYDPELEELGDLELPPLPPVPVPPSPDADKKPA